jgi:hypothetical protein
LCMTLLSVFPVFNSSVQFWWQVPNEASSATCVFC